jgi:hypothetical protein
MFDYFKSVTTHPFIKYYCIGVVIIILYAIYFRNNNYSHKNNKLNRNLHDISYHQNRGKSKSKKSVFRKKKKPIKKKQKPYILEPIQ